MPEAGHECGGGPNAERPSLRARISDWHSGPSWFLNDFASGPDSIRVPPRQIFFRKLRGI